MIDNAQFRVKMLAEPCIVVTCVENIAFYNGLTASAENHKALKAQRYAMYWYNKRHSMLGTKLATPKHK